MRRRRNRSRLNSRLSERRKARRLNRRSRNLRESRGLNDSHLRKYETPSISLMKPDEQRYLAHQIIITSENDGDAYRRGDAEGAIQDAFDEQLNLFKEDLNYWFRNNTYNLKDEADYEYRNKEVRSSEYMDPKIELLKDKTLVDLAERIVLYASQDHEAYKTKDTMEGVRNGFKQVRSELISELEHWLVSNSKSFVDHLGWGVNERIATRRRSLNETSYKIGVEMHPGELLSMTHSMEVATEGSGLYSHVLDILSNNNTSFDARNEYNYFIVNEVYGNVDEIWGGYNMDIENIVYGRGPVQWRNVDVVTKLY